VIGVPLLAGVATRFALTLALLLMFGVTMKQDWATAGTQLGYGPVLAALLFARRSYDVPWRELLRR